MNDLKVAILLAGGLRTFWYSIDNILENFVIPNNADVFVYTGNDNSHGNSKPIVIDDLNEINKKKCSMTLTRLNPNIEGRNIIMDEETFIKEKLHKYLKGIQFMTEEDIIQFNNDFNKKIQHFDEYKKNNTIIPITESHKGPQKFIFDQYFKIYKCNEMKKKYAIENNINYDYVIRLRPDFYYDNTINLNKLNLESNTLYAPDQYSHGLIKFLLAEWFYFGDNKTMDIMTSGLYEQIYTNIEPHGREFNGFNGIKPHDYSFIPEAQFAWISNSNNLNVKMLKISKKNDYIGNRVEVSKYNFIKKYVDNEFIYIIYCTINLDNFIY